ncbi:RTJK polymerase, partial [Pseudoatta argentina]
MEAQFLTAGITVEETKYNYVIQCLDDDSLTEVSDIVLNPPATDMPRSKIPPVSNKARRFCPEKLRVTKQEFEYMMQQDLYLMCGYQQIPVRESDISKTAIITPFGLFEFLYMIFGLRNAAQTFQRFMDRVTARLDIQSAEDIKLLPEKVQAIAESQEPAQRKLRNSQRTSTFFRKLGYQTFSIYEGRNFHVITDHIFLVYAFKRKSDQMSPRQTCQLLFISNNRCTSRSRPFRMTLQKKKSDYTFLNHYKDEFSTWIKCLIQAAEVGSKRRTTAYHSESNVIIERWHRSLKTALMCYGETQWTDTLTVILFRLRTCFIEDLGTSVAELVRHYAQIEGNRRPLEQSYTGSHKVLECISDKVFAIEVDGRCINATADRFKSAYLVIQDSELRSTDWACYKTQVEETLNISLPLKTGNDITKAVEHFNQCIQQAAWNATPVKPTIKNANVSSVLIRRKIAENRQIRKKWQIIRSPELKSKLNKAIKDLRKMLKSEVNENIQDYLRTLSPTQGINYSLWKATKRLKQPQISVPPLRLPDGEWARSAQAKAETFAQHLKQVFTPHSGETQTDENEIHRSFNETYQMESPLEKFKMSEVIKTIKYDISPKKAPGYDLIPGKILQNLDLEDLKAAIEGYEHKVIRITNIRERTAQKSLPLFIIEIEPKDNNKSIYNILLNIIVSFEPLRKKREIPQCQKCQGYGHTKNYCFKTSYKGCLMRKQLQQKLYPTLKEKSVNQQTQNQLQSLNCFVKPNITYARAARTDHKQYTTNITQPQIETQTITNTPVTATKTRFTNKNYIKIPNYTIYDTKHPSGRAQGGTAVIIKTTIKHHLTGINEDEFIQATNVTLNDQEGSIIVSAVYCPPKHSIKTELFQKFFKSLGHRFIAAGDFNAKHPWWGSRSLTPTPRGRQLYATLQAENLTPISTGEPTYWPSDLKKSPDLLDFAIVKSIDPKCFIAKSCLDLSSDHSPIIITFTRRITMSQKIQYLYNGKTNWTKYKLFLDKQSMYVSRSKQTLLLRAPVECVNTVGVRIK